MLLKVPYTKKQEAVIITASCSCYLIGYIVNIITILDDLSCYSLRQP